MACSQTFLGLGTGVPEIDASHEGLRFLVERIFEPGVECRRDANGCDHSRCQKISAIMRYLGRNFAGEEALMTQAAYPGHEDHRRDHTKLLTSLEALQAARMCGERDKVVVRKALDSWAAAHHGGKDHRLGRWATTRRIVEPGE